MAIDDIKRNLILNEEEISKLFTFVRSKGVRYIDVSHEIVDHLASAIEEQMNKSETLTFEQALSQVYSVFPITGFYHFVQEKEKALSKFWYKVIKDYAVSYVNSPKILILIGLLATIFSAVYVFGQTAAVTVSFVAFLLNLYYIYSDYKYFKNLIVKKEEYLIFNSYYFRFVNVFFAPFLLFSFIESSFFTRINLASPIQVILFSTIITLYLLWSYGCLTYFKERLSQEVKTNYKHLNNLGN